MDSGLASDCESKTHPRWLPGCCVTLIWPSQRFDVIIRRWKKPVRFSGKMLLSSLLHLCDRPNHEYREDGRRALVCDFRVGESCLHDLKRDPSALLDKPLFVDHVLLAVGVHIAQTYGGMRPVSRLVRGGLAPWQERRAKDSMIIFYFRRQSRWCAGQGAGSGMSVIKRTFFARVSTFRWNDAAQLAN